MTTGINHDFDVFFVCFFKSSVLFQILIINFAVVGDKRILICSFGFIAGLIKKI